MPGQSNQDNHPLFFPKAFKANLEKSLYTLEGIIHGMSIDGKIGPEELAELTSWYNAYTRLSNRSPFNELIPLIKNAITDEVLTKEEAANIMNFIRSQISPNPYFDNISADIRRLHGVMQGILTDDHIGEEELRKLQDWLNDNLTFFNVGIDLYKVSRLIGPDFLRDGQSAQGTDLADNAHWFHVEHSLSLIYFIKVSLTDPKRNRDGMCLRKPIRRFEIVMESF